MRLKSNSRPGSVSLPTMLACVSGVFVSQRRFMSSIRGRLELRKKLKCKSFKWYLENVYPELK